MKCNYRINHHSYKVFVANWQITTFPTISIAGRIHLFSDPNENHWNPKPRHLQVHLPRSFPRNFQAPNLREALCCGAHAALLCSNPLRWWDGGCRKRPGYPGTPIAGWFIIKNKILWKWIKIDDLGATPIFGNLQMGMGQSLKESTIVFGSFWGIPTRERITTLCYRGSTWYDLQTNKKKQAWK